MTLELAKTSDNYMPRFLEVELGAFRQAIFGYTRNGRTVIEKTAGNRTTFTDHKGNELGRTFQHKRRVQCQATRLLQPHVVESQKSNVSFDLVKKEGAR